MFFPVDCLPHLIDCSLDSEAAVPSADSTLDNSAIMPHHYGGNTTPGIHVLRMLQMGPKGAAALCRQIIRTTRFEYTTEGIRLVVHGAEMPYSVCPSAEALQLEREGKERAATRIQVRCRGMLGRQRVKQMTADRSRWDLMQRMLSSRQVRYHSSCVHVHNCPVCDVRFDIDSAHGEGTPGSTKSRTNKRGFSEGKSHPRHTCTIYRDSDRSY